jgi:predicted GNAT family N-acyltransferase
MPETPHFMVRRADWSVDEAAIARVRRKVFIDEQAVPEELEWETLDPECIWFVAEVEGREVVGIVRLTAEARIGRMAVLAPWRRRGVGAALLTAALSEARRQGYISVRLSAQTHALPFYVRFGFQPEGTIYQDAGIPHLAMTITFKDSA